MLGQTISHYRILRKLGGGGMGVVYEAEDITLGRKVALKFLPEGMATDAGMLARLQREARAASALNHPNICTIYAVEEDQGHFFISMELLEGKPLDQLLQEKALTNDQIIDFALQICDALETAHSKGVVHRDIKPANIFVTTRNQVKVLDFGLAKIEQQLQAAATTMGASVMEVNTAEFGLTRPGTAMGTVAYMSPEQARGEELDARTDIFSFGVVLYQMATRKVPFDGATSAVVFSKILEHPPVSPVEVNPDLHTQLDEIIRKTLEKDRDLRYQTATGVAADLRRLKRDTSSTRPAVVGGKPTPPSTSKIWFVVAAVALIAIIAGAVYWMRAKHAQQSASVVQTLALVPLTNVGDAQNAYLSAGITKDIAAKLAQLPNVKVESGEQSGATMVVSGTVVRSGDAVVVSTNLTDPATKQSLWSHQYTANTSELQALEGQIAGDIAERAGIQLGWEQRQTLQAVQTSSPEAYLLYLQARYELDQHSDAASSDAAGLLKQAVAKDANFKAAADALAQLEKASPQEAAQAEPPVPEKRTAAKPAGHAKPSAAMPSATPVPAPVPAPAAPREGTISIQSQPAGASIFLDGRDTGKKTPAQLAAAAGAHSIVLKQDGYADATANTNVQAGVMVPLSATLTKLAAPKEIKAIGGFKKLFGGASEKVGRVHIETKPKGAKVMVGEQPVSKPTPVEFDLAPGTYQVTIEADGYQPVQKTIEVEAGKRVQVSETLSKK